MEQVIKVLKKISIQLEKQHNDRNLTDLYEV